MTLAHAAESLNIHKYPTALEQTASQTEYAFAGVLKDGLI